MDGSDIDLQVFREQIADHVHRGTIVGVDGVLGFTEAGEYTIEAREVQILAKTDQHLPMMNWTHKKSLKDAEKRYH